MPTPLKALCVTTEAGVPTHSGIPLDLVSGTGTSPRPRLRVDQARTSFFEGREFRISWEFDIPANTTSRLMFASPIDFVLFRQSLYIDKGALKFTAISNATVSTMGTPVNVLGKNRMAERPSPQYASQATVLSGGSYTGGTVVETIRLYSEQQGNSAVTVGASQDDARGLPAGNYFLMFANLGNTSITGVYDLAWEERQPRSASLY